MRKLSVFAAAMMVAVGVFAATNDVTSVNAVGFVKTTVPDGGWALISVPFEDIDGSGTMTISDIVPKASNLSKAWIYRNGAWMSSDTYYDAMPGWYPGTNEFIRSDAIFINAPVGGGDIDINANGEVPGDYAPTSTVVVADGWTLMGYPYPADITLEASDLANKASNLDKIWHWNQSSGMWESIATYYDAMPGWYPTNVTLRAGEGYFYNSTGGGFDWTETKPYVWP